MRAVIQRVSYCHVIIGGLEHAAIDQGLLILLGIEDADVQDDIDWLVRKILNIRIFDDEKGIMNNSVTDIAGELMVVSQFTLHASIKKGNRPSYLRASKGPTAIPLYHSFLKSIASSGLVTCSGVFGADMKVSLSNDGPVTIIIDTKHKE